MFIVLTNISSRIQGIVITDTHFTLYPYFGTPITLTRAEAIRAVEMAQVLKAKERGDE